MSDNAVIESDVELEAPVESSSDDVRGAVASAFKEVNDRARDEAGRFAANKEQVAPRAEKAARGPDTSADGAPVEQQPRSGAQQDAARAGQQAENTATNAATAPAAIRPPDTWSPAAKAKFASLDPDIQAEIARREADVHKGFTKHDEHRVLGKTFESTVQPYLAMIKSEGSDPVKAVDALLQTAYTLRAGTTDQKENAVIGILQQYGVNPQRIFQKLSGGQQTPQRQVDPQVAALTQTVQQLQQRLSQGDAQIAREQEAQIAQTIEGFASDPKNIYFANVRHQMGLLIQAADAQGKTLGLQEAYDAACWSHPEIRPLLLQSQDQQRQADARARATRARAAGSTLVGSPTGGASLTAPSSHGSLADDIRTTYREVMNRE